ncbi:21850_t:CDS:2, partial [Gigaspora rosea]
VKAVFQKGILWFKVLSRYRLLNILLNQEYVKIKQLIESILNIFVLQVMGAVFTGEEQYTAINIAAGIENTIYEIGENKIVAIITNNANVMKAAWEILKSSFPQK